MWGRLANAVVVEVHMSPLSKLLRLLFVPLFILSMLPAAVFQSEPVQAAAPGWMKHPGQLTLPGQKYVLDSFVIKDGATYKMWYTYLKTAMAPSDFFAALKTLHADRLMTSLNILDFNGFLLNLADLNVDMAAIWTLVDGVTGAIGYATSSDGKTWADQPGDALAGAPADIWHSVGNPTVVKVADGDYRMWYTRVASTLDSTVIQNAFTAMATPAQRSAALGSLADSTRTVIGYATSVDGVTFTESNATVLAGSGSGWEALNSVFAPSVVQDSGSNFKMWYSRIKSPLMPVDLDALLAEVLAGTLDAADVLGILNGMTTVIGLADSTDGGATWSFTNSQVLAPGTTIFNGAYDPVVLKTATGYEMWYSTGVSNLDAPKMTNIKNELLGFNIPNLWNSMKTKTFSDFLLDLAALNTANLETLLTGTTGNIGYATSTTGANWVVEGAANLTGVAATPWSGVRSPAVIRTGVNAEMWFFEGIADFDWQALFAIASGDDLPIGMASTRVLQSIIVAPATASLAKGRNMQYTATASFSDGTTDPNFASAIGISWISSQPGNATIGPTGVATALAVGPTQITATFGSVTSNAAALNVVPAVLTGIVVTPDNDTRAQGRTRQFTATGSYSDGSNANVTAFVNWTSSVPGFATIGLNTGFATAVAPGTTVITATDPATSVFDTTNFTATAAEVDRLAVTPEGPSLAKGDSLQFTAVEYLSNGVMVDRTAAATWSKIVGSGDATLSPTTGGLVTGSAVGTVDIRADYGGRNDTERLTVTAPRVTGMVIDEPAPGVPLGDTQALHATAAYSDGSSGSVTVGVTWASLNPAVATVSSTGVVTTVSVGTATIRATYLGMQANVVFTVGAKALRVVAVTPATATVTAGGSVQFTAIGTYSDGSMAPLTTVVGDWSKTGNATLSATVPGLATGTTAGSATITVTLTGFAPANGVLTVTGDTLGTITVTPDPATVKKGRTQQFVATGRFVPSNTDVVITGQVTWSAVAGTGSATITSGGLATGTGVGGVTIRATMQTPAGTVTGERALTVQAPVLDAITVTPVNPSIAKGRTQPFVATGRFSDNTTSVVTNSVTWTSGSPGVATIGPTTGLAASVTTGTALITATDPGNGAVFNSTTLTVGPAVLTSVTVAPLTGSIAAGKDNLQFTATGHYSDSSTANITNSAVWTSSNPAVAGFSAAGKPKGLAAGGTAITASSGGFSASAILTVTAAELDSVAISPISPTIAVAGTQQFRAVATYSDGQKVDVTSTATWTTDDALVASLSATTKGLATGAGVGNTNIRVSLTVGVITKNNNTGIRVTAAALSSLAITAVAPDTLTPAAGTTTQLKATGTYADASTADLTDRVTWASSNTAVARVGSSGRVTTYTAGSTNISASLAPAAPAFVAVNVGTPLLDSITVTPDSPEVTFISGAPPTVQLRATGVYTDGSTKDISADLGDVVNWTVLPAGVATIGLNTGLATTVAAGTTVVTATHPGTGKTGTTNLTVNADTVAPTVVISSPADGFTTDARNLTISGTVSDPNVVLTLILNGVSTGLPAGATFSQGVVLDGGSNTISVRATDGVGNDGMSGTITVKVEPNKPSIVLTSPAADLVTRNSIATVVGTATNATMVSVVVNSASTTVAVAGGAFSLPVTLTSGRNIIAVTAYHKDFPATDTYLGASGARTVTLDTQAPIVRIATPVSGSVVGSQGITVSGTVDDPAVTNVNLVHNAGVPLTVTVVNGRFSQDIAIAVGANTLGVSATDVAGNSATATTSVTLDTSKPEVTVTSPLHNSLTRSSSITVSGTVSDPSISTATVLINGVAQPAITVSADGSFGKVFALGAGTSTIEVTAQDVAANIGRSGPVSVTVDTAAPIVTVGLTDPTDSVTITVTSSEALGQVPTVTVTVSTGASTVVVMDASDINTWVGNYSVAGAGDYTVAVSGTDVAGNTGTSEASFSKEVITVDGVDPTPVTSGDTTLAVETNGAVAAADISVTSHLENPSGNVGAPAGAPAEAGAFVEINASPELLNNLKQIYIEVAYDPAEIGGAQEDSLRLYLWDVTNGTWKIVPGSGVDTIRKVIFGTVTHLSKYGGFGAAVPGVPGGGGVGGAIDIPGTVSFAASVLPSGVFASAVAASSADQIVTVQIAQGTLGRTKFNEPVTVLRFAKVETAQVLPANLKAIGAAFDITPDGSTFDRDITIRFKYDKALLPAGAREANMYIVTKEGANWVKLPSQVNTTAGTVSATTKHLTLFMVVVPTAPAAFTYSAIISSPSGIELGGSATFTVTVTNSGDLAGPVKLEMKANGVVVGTQEFTLADKESKTVTFSPVFSKAGTYNITIGDKTTTFNVSEVPVPPKPAVFTTSGLALSSTSVETGEAVKVTVKVANTGALQGTYKVTLKVNNAIEGTSDVTLAGGASQDVTFTVTRAQPGIYAVTVDEQTVNLTVKAPPPPPPPEEEEKPVVVTGPNWPAIIGGVIGGVVLIALVVLLLRRARKQ